jgi:hypothetical protein
MKRDLKIIHHIFNNEKDADRANLVIMFIKEGVIIEIHAVSFLRSTYFYGKLSEYFFEGVYAN